LILVGGPQEINKKTWVDIPNVANPSCVPNLKSLASAVAEILKKTPKFWGAPLAQGHTHFLFW